jgi:hypothetical protein
VIEHVMIDLETLGKGSHAAIWTIGAVKFDMHYAETIDELLDTTDKFHVRINMKSSFALGRADAGTIEWWMQPERDLAREAIFKMPDVDLIEALDGFKEWFGEDKPVWGNGATFDNVILSNAFSACTIERPWSYKSDRCYRTFKSLAPDVKPIDVGVAHGALDDALAQAWHMQRIVKHLNLTL